MTAPVIAIPSPHRTAPVLQTRVLLVSGILSSLLYAAMNVFIPMLWDGYNSASRVVSELSAIDAPTRALWVALGIVYGVLVTLFGFGVWTSARGNRALRVVGALLIAYGAFDIIPWPPMHLREVLAAGGATLTDTLHIVWSMIAVLLMILVIAFGAAAFGRWFRKYSIGTLITLAIFGVLTGVDSPGISANVPTPWIGVWERINIGVYMLWVVVLAIALLRARDRRSLIGGAQ